jgi:hypothetical protein
MNDDKICSVCLGLKPVACELPNGAPLCFDCVVKGTEYGHRTVMEKKCACVAAKFAMLKEMEDAIDRMRDKIRAELASLGLSVEAEVEFLAKNGRKVGAIKLHRDAHGCTLMEAKKYVDDLENW